MKSTNITFLKNYEVSEYLITDVQLDISISKNKTTVTAKLKIKENPNHPKPSGTIFLNGSQLTLVSVAIDNSLLAKDDYQLKDDILIIPGIPQSFVLTTEVKITPRSNSSLSGLYVSKNGYFTQCEAEGFRRITYFLDRPDIMATFTTKITANKNDYPTLLSNGNLVQSGEEGDNHWVIWKDPFPKPCYLFAMVAANLSVLADTFVTMSGRLINLNIYVPHGQKNRCQFAMNALKNAMKWDEDNFGLEIDLDQYAIVAVDDFNMGAMENKGLNIFNSKYILADPEISTDKDYMFIDRVVAHEYFHNWTGNRVTCRDWFQLSLKEGLTVFRDQEYGADTYSRSTQRIQEVRNLRNIQFPEDASAMAHAVRPQSYVEINNFYTATVYEKGAEIVRMIDSLLGKEQFVKGMNLYFERHDGTAATTDDFVSAMQDASNYDLSQFKLWYDRPGTPKLTARGTYNEALQTYELVLEQSLTGFDFTKEEPLHIPVAVGLIGAKGIDLNIQLENNRENKTTHLISLKKKRQSYMFSNVSEKPVPSILRGFSAPVILEYSKDPISLRHQMAYDSDSFNRWEACQTLTIQVLLKNIHRIQTRTLPEYPDYYISAMRQLLESSRKDPSFLAEVITLPSENFMAEQVNIVDPESIHNARVNLRKHIATAFRNLMLEIYTENSIVQPYSPDSFSAGKRALKNTCLQYLMELEENDIKLMCIDQFKNADNMTDRLSSLVSILNNDSQKKEWALQHYYSQWKNDPSAIDKWFSVQASSRAIDTLKIVKSLTQHKAFDYSNPNKVYALIRSFGVNHLRFHDKSGEGYNFLADQIIKLDGINPQVAARISRSYDRCKRLDHDRWSLACKALTKINNFSSLSKDTREVISKILH